MLGVTLRMHYCAVLTVGRVGDGLPAAGAARPHGARDLHRGALQVDLLPVAVVHVVLQQHIYIYQLTVSYGCPVCKIPQ